MPKSCHRVVEMKACGFPCPYPVLLATSSPTFFQGFVFVHMKSLEEASRAVTALDCSEMPHLSGAPATLAAAIWREDLYQALMSRENMRIYADSMRAASTWYEKQTKSGVSELQAKVPCRFFALGRGCIFGKNCGFSHNEGLPQQPPGAVDTHAGAAGPSFGGPPLPKPLAHAVRPIPAFEPGSGAASAGVAQLPYGHKRIPVLAHEEQSPTLTLVHKSEAQPGLGTQGSQRAAYAGNSVGVAAPWQPEHGSGVSEARASDRASSRLGTSNGRSAGHQQQPPRGGGPSKAADNLETRDGHSRVYSNAGNNARRSGYPNSAHSREGSVERYSDGGGGGGRRDDRYDRQGERSARGFQQGKDRSRGRGDSRCSPLSSISGPRGSPRRSSGDFQRRGVGRLPSRDSGRQRDRRESRSRRSENRENALERSSRKHHRDSGTRQQRRGSRSSSPRRHPRDDFGATKGRSATRREWAPREARDHDRLVPVGNGRRHRDASYSPRGRERRYDSDGAEFDLDGRRRKKRRNEQDDSRRRDMDHGRMGHSRSDDSDGGRGPFLGSGGGRRERNNVAHGWISSNSGAFSRDGDRRSFGGSLGGGHASHLSEKYRADDSRDRDGAAGGNRHDDDELFNQEFIRLESPPRPVQPKFFVTGAAPKTKTKFSVTIPPDLAGGLAQPTSPSGGRRGGRPARGRGRGRGRGGRSGNHRGGRPPRGFQHDDVEDLQ